jgi:hypothetical protein
MLLRWRLQRKRRLTWAKIQTLDECLQLAIDAATADNVDVLEEAIERAKLEAQDQGFSAKKLKLLKSQRSEWSSISSCDLRCDWKPQQRLHLHRHHTTTTGTCSSGSATSIVTSATSSCFQDPGNGWQLDVQPRRHAR